MTGREKMEAAFSPDGAPDFACVLCYTSIYVRDHWAQLTAAPWWDIHSPDFERQLAWRREVMRNIGEDWMGLPSFYLRDERQDITLEVRGDGVYRVNRRRGTEERLEPPVVSGAHIPEVTLPLPETIDEVDAQFPLPPAFEQQSYYESGAADLATLLLAWHGEELYPVAQLDPPSWVAYELWGFEGGMTMIATRPDLVQRACERKLAWGLRQAEELAARGAAAVWIDEAFTDVISPAAYAELSLPYMQRLVEGVRALGMKSIFCFLGNPEGKWEHILAAGADALALEESKKGWTIDIAEVAERVDGRCVLFGNLDAINLLEHGSEAELRAEITRQVAAGRRNHSRFVMCIGSPVTPGTSVERVRLFCDLAHEIGAS